MHRRQSKPTTIKAPRAALALAERHLSLRDAHNVVTRLFIERGQAGRRGAVCILGFLENRNEGWG
jgi:hypothetical protein